MNLKPNRRKRENKQRDKEKLDFVISKLFVKS